MPSRAMDHLTGQKNPCYSSHREKRKGGSIMKSAIVIGGRGKVGTYLIPLLCAEGYDVTCISRGQSREYLPDPCWAEVRQLTIDRNDEAFAQRVAEREADVVVDMICFHERDMLALTEALAGRTGHYIACGSLWMHGRSDVVPMAEHECRTPICEYGREKLKMDETLARLYARDGFPGTIVHPGHIVCVGHRPVNPQGNGDLTIFTKLLRGEEVLLPNLGMETLHHVHAADIAGLIMAAIHAGGISYGQGFHAASPRAVTLRGYAREVASWAGQEARLTFLPLDEWEKRVSPDHAATTRDHIEHSPNASMEKALRLLGFAPRYTSYQAVRESLPSLIESVLAQ